MKNVMRWALGLLVASGCATVHVPPPIVALRPMAIHTCVAGARIWLDGAAVPPLEGPTCTAGTCTADGNGNLAANIAASLPAFNLHATAAGHAEYGAVIQTTPSTDPLVIILGSCAK